MKTNDNSPLPEDWARYRGYLRVLARAGIGPSLQAKVDPSDIVQQTLLNAYRDVKAFRGSTDEEMRAWLRRILQNNIAQAVRHFHQHKRDVNREQAVAAAVQGSSIRLEKLVLAGESNPSDDVVRQERILGLCTAIEGLPDDQRRAIDLHHLQGKRISEIAETMDRSVTAVAGLLKRGMKRLREVVRNDC